MVVAANEFERIVTKQKHLLRFLTVIKKSIIIHVIT